MQWQYQTDKIPQDLQELETVLLENRSVSESVAFFKPPHPNDFSLAELGFVVAQAEAAVQCIQTACQEKKDILIFGDYDADGICATAVLWEALADLGCIARPFIPVRDKHGYGLTIAALEEIIAHKKPDMIITVDNGIVAHPAAKFAQEQGIQLIISDHHQPEKTEGVIEYPPAEAIFHTTQLCGTTVAWVLGRELGAQNTAQTLDLCGLATISDQVPLKDANRAFAYHGIAALNTTQRIGIKALCEDAGAVQAELDSYSIGFTIAPRINAMGRLSHGLDALRLLCTKNMLRARELASILGETNVQRQDITTEQLSEAVSQVEVQVHESVVIAHSRNFHEGVIGLIAGRLVEKFSKPALVMSVTETYIKGSARSVAGVNVTELLRSVREELSEVGGHPMAGGFSLTHEKLETFKTKLFAMAKKTIDAQLLIPSLELECQLPANLLAEETCTLVEKFAPFGSQNHKPIFGFTQMRVVGCKTMGKEHQHLKLIIEPADFTADPIDALWWRHGEDATQFSSGQVIACAGYLECSSWKGKKRMQLVLKDVQL